MDPSLATPDSTPEGLDAPPAAQRPSIWSRVWKAIWKAIRFIWTILLPGISFGAGILIGVFGERGFLCDYRNWFCPTPQASLEYVSVIGEFHVDDLDDYLLTEHADCTSDDDEPGGLGPGTLLHVKVSFEYASEKEFPLSYSLYHADGQDAIDGLESWQAKPGYPCASIIGTSNNVDMGVYPLWIPNPAESGVYRVGVFLLSPEPEWAIRSQAMSEPFTVTIGR